MNIQGSDVDAPRGCQELTLISVGDLHGFVDGVTREGRMVGGVRGLAKAIQDSRGSIRFKSATGGGVDLRVCVVGDMVMDYRHRQVGAHNAVQVWNAILGELSLGVSGSPVPLGATFGNHEVEFSSITTSQQATVHCRNLNLAPASCRCARRPTQAHYNAVCPAMKGTGPGSVTFCGVSDGLPDPAGDADECWRHWQSAPHEYPHPWVLLAHYSSNAPLKFQGCAPGQYDVVMKGHDHHSGCSLDDNGGLPVVMEPDANGRPIAVLRLWLKGDDVVCASYRLQGVYASPGMSWSQGLTAATAPPVYRGAFDAFGGATDAGALHLRCRAAQLALRGMEFASDLGKSSPHVFLVSPTAIRDYSMAPGPGRGSQPLDEWDLKSIYGVPLRPGSGVPTTFKTTRDEMLAALGVVLGDGMLLPWEYDDERSLLMRVGRRTYSLTLQGGAVMAAERAGRACQPGEPAPAGNVIPGDTLGSQVWATMPPWEGTRFRDLAGWTKLEPRERDNICGPTRGRWPVWQSVAELLRANPDAPYLFHC